MEGETPASAPSDGHGVAVQRGRSQQGRTSGPTRRSTKGQWTPEEDEVLRQAVERFKGKNWKKIAECFKDRTDVQCLHRWQKVLNPELVKGPWSKEEDEMIIELVNKYGPKKWSTIAQHLNGRIGKQCRERWHNHLNPAINKEAWTQEEELVLIRAHQMYGNRWAELTKFLPGRTDNAIKNHWNSSVKKKLDSYLASGLLAQFPALPEVGFQNQLVPSSSLRVQNSGVDTHSKGGTEAEEISECSQSSTVNCSQSANETSLAIYGEKVQLADETGLSNEQNTSPSLASCSDQYYPIMEEGTLMIPDAQLQMSCSSDMPQQSFLSEEGSAVVHDYKIDANYLPNVSLMEVGQVSTGLTTHSMGSNRNFSFPFQVSVGSNVLSTDGSSIGADFLQQILISEDECCRILFSESIDDGCFPSDNYVDGQSTSQCGGPPGAPDLVNPQTSDQAGVSCFQSIDRRSVDLGILCAEPGSTLASLSHSHNLSSSVVSDAPCNEPSTSASLFHSVNVDARQLGRKDNASADYSLEVVDNPTKCTPDGFIYANDSANSPGEKDNGSGVIEQLEFSKDQSRLVPANAFSSGSDSVRTCPLEENSNGKVEKQDSGSLCYEPPRFPSLDVPFFSCDLIQSSNDMQQEYSPLGIRQLMMPSMKCISPLRLWDSPSQDKSSDFLLKSAAKTFTCTPSIIKKRNRDLLSPLSDRRIDKKLVTDIAVNLSRDFSRLEVFLNEDDNGRVSLLSPSFKQKSNSDNLCNDKENVHMNVEVRQQHGGDCEVSGAKDAGDHSFQGDIIKTKEEGILPVDGKVDHVADFGSAFQLAHLTEVLSEHDINDLLLFSPDLHENKRQVGSVATPGKQCLKNMAPSAHDGISLESSSGNFIQPTNRSSATLEGTVDNALTIFGGTPFRGSMESPSAWKSPWFINSFLPGPRIETEITIEDIGYLMSPGDKSYDALGLMKHLSEHSAAAFAHAQEVLGSDTPETLLKKSFNHLFSDHQNRKSSQKKENCPYSTSNALTERRTLDFSECETPRVPKERGKFSTTMSSPSGYLLKGCR